MPLKWDVLIMSFLTMKNYTCIFFLSKDIPRILLYFNIRTGFIFAVLKFYLLVQRTFFSLLNHFLPLWAAMLVRLARAIPDMDVVKSPFFFVSLSHMHTATYRHKHTHQLSRTHTYTTHTHTTDHIHMHGETLLICRNLGEF